MVCPENRRARNSADKSDDQISVARLSLRRRTSLNDDPAANVEQPRPEDRRPVTFQEAFCARYRCPAAQFPDRAFRRCLYPHAVPLALVLRRLAPAFFREDLQLIQQLGLDQDLEEVDAALSDFQYVNRARRHWLRTGLKIRLSGRRVRELAADLLG